MVRLNGEMLLPMIHRNKGNPGLASKLTQGFLPRVDAAPMPHRSLYTRFHRLTVRRIRA